MSDILPNDLETIPPTTLPNRRDFLRTTGTVAGLATAGVFTQLLPGNAADKLLTPNKYNLRDVNGSNYITEVRDQGTCNACTAFATIAAIEGAISIKTNTSNPQLHLSEAQLFDCAGPGCDTNAWYPKGALEYCQNHGITTYGNYGGFGQCRPDNPNWPLTKISNFEQLPDATAMKQCISGTGPYTQSPVISVFVLYNDLEVWKPTTPNKFYKHNDKSPQEIRIGGHAVCIVGYDDSPGYWICKNCWGPGWGGVGDGFFNINYGDCHIDDFRMYGVVP
jgi:C1A family cysteine protease